MVRKTREKNLNISKRTGVNVARDSDELPPSKAEAQYEMDPETRAVFEDIMKRRHKLLKQLAKL